jgi:hypothetical protein
MTESEYITNLEDRCRSVAEHIITRLCKRARKIEFEKEMKEKNKNRWVSVVSVPMGGQNKK